MMTYPQATFSQELEVVAKVFWPRENFPDFVQSYLGGDLNRFLS
jgi:hypothetical protein